MAIVGFVALVLLGAYLILAGLYFSWLGLVFGDQGPERFIPLVMVIFGGAALWAAFANSPFTVTVSA